MPGNDISRTVPTFDQGEGGASVRLSFGRRRSRAAFRYLAEDAPSGYGDAADRLVRAVRESGVRVEYRAWPLRGQDASPKRARRDGRDPDPEARVASRAPTVAHLVPEYLPNVRKVIRGGPLIAHTVWETDRLPSHWPALLDHVDRIIVPTAWNHEVFVASGVTKPVVVVPHVVCDPLPGDGGVPLGLPTDVVVFYTIGRWDQRKAPAAVIRGVPRRVYCRRSGRAGGQDVTACTVPGPRPVGK